MSQIKKDVNTKDNKKTFFFTILPFVTNIKQTQILQLNTNLTDDFCSCCQPKKCLPTLQ